MRIALCLAIVVASSVESRFGVQDGDLDGLAFEVVSVRPNDSGTAFIRLGPLPGNRLRAENVTSRQLIQYAFGLMDFQIVGGPAWVERERFDLMAIAPDGTETSQYRAMVRSVLAERFGLVAHIEAREVETFALVLDRDDGRLGPNVRPSSGECKADESCGFRTEGSATFRRLSGRAVPMDAIVEGLSELTNSIIVNETELSGEFDFSLEWTPDVAQALPNAPPILTTALREQLGVRLATARTSVDVLVIDRIERPTPN